MGLHGMGCDVVGEDGLRAGLGWVKWSGGGMVEWWHGVGWVA